MIATENAEVVRVYHLARPPDQMDPLMTFIKHFIRPCCNTTGIFNYPKLTGFQPWMLDSQLLILEGKEKDTFSEISSS